MADRPDNQPDGTEGEIRGDETSSLAPDADSASAASGSPEAGRGGSELTQEALDALLAAAGAEGGGGFDASFASDEAGAESPGAPPAEAGGAVDLPSFDPPARPAGTPAFSGGPEPSGLSRVRDIPLDVTVELGRTRLLIRDILDLSAGSIIELDKIAGEPVELFANGLLVARGEVIVIDDNFGVRVTEIITAADRHSSKEADALAA